MELQAKLFYFGEYMFLPCQSAVKVNTYVFGSFSLWGILSIQFNRGAGFTVKGEGNAGWFIFIGIVLTIFLTG